MASKAQCGSARNRVMIRIYLRLANGTWFGLAEAADGIVATTTSSTKRGALGDLLRSLPAAAPHEVAEAPAPSAQRTLALLSDLESGREPERIFSLSRQYVQQPLATVLKTAAGIPVGYVTSYGNIARAAGTEARVVGSIMASNPLYPIGPCHRVVGADLSLVGYRRSRQAPALEAKLARLRSEIRGYAREREVWVEGRALTVYPVEWVVKKAAPGPRDDSGQGTLFGDPDAA